MTRKQYQRRMQELVLAIWREGRKHGSVPEKGLGKALRAAHDNAKSVVAKFGSYDAIWNEPTFAGIRKMYGM